MCFNCSLKNIFTYFWTEKNLPVNRIKAPEMLQCILACGYRHRRNNADHHQELSTGADGTRPPFQQRAIARTDWYQSWHVPFELRKGADHTAVHNWRNVNGYCIMQSTESLSRLLKFGQCEVARHRSEHLDLCGLI